MSAAARIESAILKALNSAGLSRPALALKCHDSTISRWKSEGRITEIAAFLDSIGLKVVPITFECVSPERKTMILQLAKIGAQHAVHGDLFTEDDPE